MRDKRELVKMYKGLAELLIDHATDAKDHYFAEQEMKDVLRT